MECVVPILREETAIYPNALLDDASAEAGSRRWMVLYTKARQEKALARDLLAYQIPFYLPLVRKMTLARGRRRTSFAPLFCGYVFLFGSEEERVRSLTTNRISRILPVDDPDQLVFDLRQVRQLIAANVPLTVESRMGPGQRVRVRQGAFAGLEGVVLKRRGETRLLVSINFLQQGASVEIDDFLLDPVV
jgi:transcription antitermination factor NusG